MTLIMGCGKELWTHAAIEGHPSATASSWDRQVWTATARVVMAAVWLLLQTHVLAFEIPDHLVCANLETAACEKTVG